MTAESCINHSEDRWRVPGTDLWYQETPCRPFHAARFLTSSTGAVPRYKQFAGPIPRRKRALFVFGGLLPDISASLLTLKQLCRSSVNVNSVATMCLAQNEPETVWDHALCSIARLPVLGFRALPRLSPCFIFGCGTVQVGVLVIGAGPTGLGAATRLQQHGLTDWLIIDKASLLAFQSLSTP